MATLTTRTGKGSPLTNAELDANFTNLNAAIGGSGTTLPSPTGTGVPVLNISPTISTNLFGGTQANTTRFPYAFASISSVTGTQVNETTTYIGLISEGKGSGAYEGVGIYGVGYSSASLRGTGVVGEGHVTATGDTASAVGVRGYSNDTHASGWNVALFADANNSAIKNYALYINSGEIYTSGARTWELGGTLTFSGTSTVTIPTLSVTTISGAHNGTVGATSPNTGAFTNLSYTGTLSGSTGIMNIGSGQIYKDASGNVGIGTNSPSTKLDVNGNLKCNAIYTNSTAYIGENASTNEAAIELGDARTGNGFSYIDFHSSVGSDYDFRILRNPTVNGDLSFVNLGTGAQTFLTNGYEAMRIDASGNVGIGTKSPGVKLEVNGAFACGAQILTGYSVSTADVSIDIGEGRTGDGNCFLDFHSGSGVDWSARLIKGPGNNSNFYVYPGIGYSNGAYMTYNANSWSSVSDERNKDIIEPINDAIQKVLGLRAVIGKYKHDNDGIRRAFLIAQDVQKVLPEAVNTQDDEKGTLGVQYTDVIPLLVAAIKEQANTIEALKLRLDALEVK